mmetsp:Transcript_12795/g.37622  ORF Transcript_12795/g.37622 Transcript_12795/m.37622 type:complete len:204 (+) Transcript_12795:822-1433(+)
MVLDLTACVDELRAPIFRVVAQVHGLQYVLYAIGHAILGVRQGAPNLPQALRRLAEQGNDPPDEPSHPLGEFLDERAQSEAAPHVPDQILHLPDHLPQLEIAHGVGHPRHVLGERSDGAEHFAAHLPLGGDLPEGIHPRMNDREQIHPLDGVDALGQLPHVVLHVGWGGVVVLPPLRLRRRNLIVDPIHMKGVDAQLHRLDHF